MTRSSLSVGLVGALAFAPSVDAAAQEETRATLTVSLPEALAYAHAHQPELRAAVARIDEAVKTSDATRARWYPTVTGTAQLLATTTNNTTGSYIGVAGFENPRISATLPRSTSDIGLVPRASSLVGVGLSQEVFDFGRISAQVAADDLRSDVARQTFASTRLTVDYDIEEAYFAVHAAKSVLAAADDAAKRATVHRDLAQAGVEAGMRRPIELTRAEATLDRYRLETIRARRGIAVAEAVLAAAIGAPSVLVDIQTAPPAPGDLPPLDRELARAAKASPDVLAAVIRVRAQEKETTAIAAELRPNLRLSGAGSTNAGGATPTSGSDPYGSGLLPAVPNWDVGLVLAWPLFDATVTRRADRSKSAEDEARAELDVTRQRTVMLVSQAYFDVTAARDALPVLHHGLDAAIANDDQANARFREGMSNAVELADAEELRTQAEVQLALGDFELARARAALGRVVAEGL